MYHPANVENIWDERYKSDGATYGKEPIPSIEFVARFLHKDGVHVEFGGGYGRNALAIAQLGKSVICTDISSEAIAVAERDFNHPLVEYQVQDITKPTDFEDESVDSVMSFYLVQSLSPEERELYRKEALRILKPDGLFINNMLNELDEQFGIGEKIDDRDFIEHEKFYTHFFDSKEAFHLYIGFRMEQQKMLNEKRNTLDGEVMSCSWLIIGSKR